MMSKGLMELNFWNDVKHEAGKVAGDVESAAEKCAASATCRANAEKYGEKAA